MKKQAQYKGQLSGYVVERSIETYLADRYGGSWISFQNSSVTPAPTPLLINAIKQDRGGCSITALTSIFLWMKQTQNLMQLPALPDQMYETISQTAHGHGFRQNSGKTNPFRITAIIRLIWRQSGNLGRGKSYLMASRRRMVWLSDQNLPYLCNIAFGHYKFHTVTVTGYQLWQRKSGGRNIQRLLLEVQDGWTTAPRYLDVRAMRCLLSGSFTFYSLAAAWPE